MTEVLIYIQEQLEKMGWDRNLACAQNCPRVFKNARERQLCYQTCAESPAYPYYNLRSTAAPIIQPASYSLVYGPLSSVSSSSTQPSLGYFPSPCPPGSTHQYNVGCVWD